jgi:hypothetical protein
MAANKSSLEALNRATQAALELLGQAGSPSPKGYQIAASVLHDVIGLVEREPGADARDVAGASGRVPPAESARAGVAAGRPQSAGSAGRVDAGHPDVEGYYAFELDLIPGSAALAA